jgi:hypothetical protein
MEFGVSPMPETREAMVARGALFGVPAYRRIPAAGSLRAEYAIIVRHTHVIPESLDWPADDRS